MILPNSEAEHLKELRDAGPDRLCDLRGRVSLLRMHGWTLASIGDAVGANRSTTRMWELLASENDVLASERERVAPEAPVKIVQQRTMRRYLDVPERDRDELNRLAVSARRVRGWTPQDSPAREDAQVLERMMCDYYLRGVPLSKIAFHLGVTHHAVSARVKRALQSYRVAA